MREPNIKTLWRSASGRQAAMRQQRQSAIILRQFYPPPRMRASHSGGAAPYAAIGIRCCPLRDF